MKFAKKYIQLGIIIYLVIVSFMVFIQWLEYHKESDSLNHQLENDIASTMKQLESALQNPLWNYDQISIDMILRYEVDGKKIQRLVLRDNYGNTIKQLGTETSSAPTLLKKSTLEKNNHIIGTIEIAFVDYRKKLLDAFIENSFIELVIVSLLIFLSITFIITWNLSLQKKVDEKTNTLNEELKRRIKAENELQALYDQLKVNIQEIKDLYVESQCAHRAKNEFMAVMSHELRTPLNAVIGFSQLMALEPLKKEHQELIDSIHSNAESLLAMITDVLNFSAIEAGKININRQVFSLQDMVLDLKRIYDVKCQDQGLALTFDLNSSLPEQLLGDYHKIRQILVNLLDNAFKFTEEGSIQVRADLIEKDASTCTLAIAVEDTGEGIHESKLTSILEPFTQEDYSYTRKHGGIGLGLAIVKRFTEVLGGTIKIQSKKDHGSTFTITLPIGIPQAEDMPEQTSENSQPKTFRRKLSLLIVEDNKDNELVMRKIMHSQGHSVHSVSDGQSAIDAFKKTPYDMVFMDIHLPIKSGLQVSEEIRAYERETQSRPCIIVAVTADTKQDMRQKCLDAGMNAYLGKPVTIEAIVSELNKGHID